MSRQLDCRVAAVLIAFSLLVGCEKAPSTAADDDQPAASVATSLAPDEVIVLDCATHGPVIVGIRYDADQNPLEIQVGDDPWQPAIDAHGNEVLPTCPQCGQRLFVKPAAIDLTRFTVTWRCDVCDHAADDHPAIGPKNCPACEEKAYWATVRFVCREHGAFDIAQQYNEEGRIVGVRVGKDGEWGPEIDEDTGQLRRVCPKCGKPLTPERL
jgi:predicted RNA-binding Zn-ribbon protein involved in translation (DUF1610 family)